jgi:hypothetical protein
MDVDNAVSMGESLVGSVTAVIASGLTATVLTVLPTWDDDDDDDDPIPAPTLSSATATTTPLAATSLPQYEEKESELSDRSYADMHAVQRVTKGPQHNTIRCSDFTRGPTIQCPVSEPTRL